jgi:tetratricopeptide (TPR) repeat protein
MVLCVLQWRTALLLYLITFLYSATVIAFYVFDRYRLPVVPTLIVFAAFALTAAASMMSQRKYLKLGAAVVLTAAFFKLLGTHVTPNDYYLDDANAHCRLGSVYRSEGKLDDALAAYELAARIMPHYWASYYGMGEVHDQRNEPDLALANYGKARIYNPGNVDIYAHMGRIYYQKEELEKSAEHYLEAVRLKPNWGVPHYWLAKIYELQGNHREAEAHRRKLKELTLLELPAE